MKLIMCISTNGRENIATFFDDDDDDGDDDIRQRMFGTSSPVQHQIWTAVEKAPPPTPFRSNTFQKYQTVGMIFLRF